MSFRPGDVVAAGDLPHRVTLQQLARPEAQGTLGQREPVWNTLGTFWAAVRPTSGTEKTIAAQTNAIVSHVVQTRWLGTSYTPGPSLRFVFKGRNLNTVSVLNIDELNHTLVWYCNEKQTT